MNLEQKAAKKANWSEQKKTSHKARLKRARDRRTPEKLEKHNNQRRASKAKRRAAERAVESDATSEQINELFKSAKDSCAYCGVTGDWKRSLDHVMPLCLGGGHTVSNLMVCCFECNSEKSGTHPALWAIKKGLPSDFHPAALQKLPGVPPAGCTHVTLHPCDPVTLCP